MCKLDVYPYRLNRLYPWDKRMFQHTQIINEINHRKTLKDNNHTIILSSWKSLGQNIAFLHDKSPRKNRTIVNINQDNKNYVYEIPSQNNPKWRKAWGIPTKIRYGFLLFQPLFNIVLEAPAGAMRQEEEIEENRKRSNYPYLQLIYVIHYISQIFYEKIKIW